MYIHRLLVLSYNVRNFSPGIPGCSWPHMYTFLQPRPGVLVYSYIYVAYHGSLLGCFVDTHKPDIIFGTESCLSPSISSSEIFPHSYNVYRQDRSDGYGGIFLACHSKLISREILLTTWCEVVASLINYFR